MDSPLVLWGIRLTSAFVGYVCCVAFIDRPRGELLENANELFEVRPSSVEGAGLGLFVAANTIPKDTVLGTYPGVLLPLNQNLPKLQQYPACEAYIWRFSDSQYVLDPTDEFGMLQELCTGGSRVSWPLSVDLCKILTSPKQTILCRVNEPPLNKDVNVVTEEDLQKRTVTFKLERDVYLGEELFMDYGLTYDRSMYGGGTTAQSGQTSENNTTNIE
jgi:hypothetical protein